MPTTPQLCSIDDLDVPGVDHADVRAFTREAALRYDHASGDVDALYCPSCAPAQFHVGSPAGTCPACTRAIQPGIAAGRRDATAMLAALERFTTDQLPAVTGANAHLIALAHSFVSRAPAIHTGDDRFRRWAYTERGRAYLASVTNEFATNAGITADASA